VPVSKHASLRLPIMATSQRNPYLPSKLGGVDFPRPLFVASRVAAVSFSDASHREKLYNYPERETKPYRYDGIEVKDERPHK